MTTFLGSIASAIFHIHFLWFSMAIFSFCILRHRLSASRKTKVFVVPLGIRVASTYFLCWGGHRRPPRTSTILLPWDGHSNLISFVWRSERSQNSGIVACRSDRLTGPLCFRIRWSWSPNLTSLKWSIILKLQIWHTSLYSICSSSFFVSSVAWCYCRAVLFHLPSVFPRFFW